jgi:hypothetical protein
MIDGLLQSSDWWRAEQAIGRVMRDTVIFKTISQILGGPEAWRSETDMHASVIESVKRVVDRNAELQRLYDEMKLAMRENER